MVNYYLITKPGIIFGNLITLMAGFLLGSRGVLLLSPLLGTLIGLTAIMASACIFNNYIDLEIDRKMERTKGRPLADGRISTRQALLFASLLWLCGNLALVLGTNLSATLLANTGFFIYVCLYSPLKCKTVYCTAIGSIAGAIPPVVGYAAANGEIDGAALAFFALMVLWQMPHFFSIALLHLDDYKKGDVAVLPIVKGIFRTKIHMTLYILAFIPAAMALTFLDRTGTSFMVTAGVLGGIWFLFSLIGFYTTDERRWTRQMFTISLLVLCALCLVLPFDLTGP